MSKALIAYWSKTGMFGGRVARPLPGLVRLLFGVPKDLRLDLVDLETVRSWTRDLALSRPPTASPASSSRLRPSSQRGSRPPKAPSP
jgi:hypothetical protein